MASEHVLAWKQDAEDAWRGVLCQRCSHALCVSLPVRWDHPGYRFVDPLPPAGLGSSLVVLASLLHRGK